MKLFNLISIEENNEMHQSKINSIISRAKAYLVHNEKRDPGMFSIALAKTLGSGAKIGLLVGPENTEKPDLDNIENGRVEIKHVCVEYNGNYYDLSGSITSEEMFKTYSPNGGEIYSFDITDKLIELLHQKNIMDWRFYFEILKKPRNY